MKASAKKSPGGRQETPCNASRWTLLVAYTLQTVATGCVYFGWAPLSSILLSAGVFADECPRDENGNYLGDRRKDGEAFICNEQDSAVQHLYAITLAAHFTTSAVAGLLMDTLGPKITSILGQGFNFTGWSLLSTVTAHSRWEVYAAFVFIGMGADTAFLPTLLVSRLFPLSPGLVITLLGAASSASFVVPSILWAALPAGNVSGCFWYAAFGPGLFLIVDALLMPLRPFKVVEGGKDGQRLSGVAATDENDSFLARGAQQGYGSVSELVNLSANKTASGNGSGGARPESIFRTVLSECYVLIVVYFIGVSFVSSFYQEAHSRLLAGGPQRFLGWVLPLSFIPCIVLGKCSDWSGILPVMLGVNASGMLAYLCSLSQKPALGYASVLFFMVYMSLFGSQVFIYVEGTFPARQFGRLIGIIELIGGLFSLLCNPVYARAVAKPDGIGILHVQVFVIMLLLFEFIVIGRLILLRYPSKPSLHCERPVGTTSQQDEHP